MALQFHWTKSISYPYLLLGLLGFLPYRGSLRRQLVPLRGVNMLENKLGQLDGLVIFRFAPIWKEGGGGVEEHLRNANRLLLQQNRITIIQTYLNPANEKQPIAEESIGRGKLIWAPIPRPIIPRSWKSADASTILKLLPFTEKGFVGNIASNAIDCAIETFRLNGKNSFRFFCDEAGAVISNLYAQYRFDLAVLHSVATLDDAEIINQLTRLDVPFAVVHHFENRRLAHPMVRLKLRNASAIGGVSNAEIPRYLRHRFTQIREGIDTDFFQVDKALPVKDYDQEHLIFMPARIAEGKGQLDLVEAVRLLNREGLRLKLIFAGRTDSDMALKELTSSISRLDDPKQVALLGHLDLNTLRDYYAACKLVAMPSHSEGLGRILLEAQSMQRPVVAYAVGGIPSAIRHGKTGYLVSKGDTLGLAAKLRELLTNEQKRTEMGFLGRQFVEKEFGLQDLARTHEEICLSALERHTMKKTKNATKNNLTGTN